MAERLGTFVNSRVTKLKWTAELKDFKSNEQNWRQLGVFLIKEDFPNLEFIFTVVKTHPRAIAYAVRINFENYDVDPPSVKFIDPVSGVNLKRVEVPFNFWKNQLKEGIDPDKATPDQYQPFDILQGTAEMEPFICIPGIREYHHHPRHTGDSWLLYRGRGEGKLGFILDQLYSHSIIYISGFSVSMVVGFNVLQPHQIPK